MTTLSDVDIANALAAGSLISNGDPAKASGACYELRLGNVYYDLTEGEKRVELQPGESALIKPGHRVVLITHEELCVPDDVLVRIVSKGSLFSVGLSPVSTYADPGFTGNFGIVTQNVSDKYIILPVLEPIAKADFSKLSTDAAHPYQGQHGFHTQIWPIKHHLQKAHADLLGDKRVKSEKEEAYLLLPEATRQVLVGIESRQRLTDFALVLAIILNALALYLTTNQLIDQVIAIATNLVASALVGMVVFYAKFVRHRT